MLERIFDLYPDEEFLIADGFDEAIIGVDASSLRIIYDADKCIEILCEQMEYSEAEEYFEYNVLQSYVGEKTPIFVYTH